MIRVGLRLARRHTNGMGLGWQQAFVISALDVTNQLQANVAFI